jgi:phenylalanyl-tRNA synthetase beta chain
VRELEMPTISLTRKDLQGLLGREIEPEPLRQELLWAKAELKSWEDIPGSGDAEVKIELNDTNRPDTWTPEGIARQLRGCIGEGYPEYAFLSQDPVGRVEVDASVEAIRPYVGAFLARGRAITDELLRSLVQTQEKLSDTFGRKRKDVAAGIYKLDLVKLPVQYTTVAPDDTGFVPLGETRVMTPVEILASHPKGVEFAPCLQGIDRYPLLKGDDGRVLSMPPIINSADLGQVEVGDQDFFVEFTGTTLEVMNVAVSIMAADMADRGFKIERLATVYPYDTPWGREVIFPHDAALNLDVPLERIHRGIGVKLPDDEVVELLERFGLKVERKDGGTLNVQAPFYRNDLLHPMDIVEDVAICRGYDSFPHHSPESYTVGRLSDLELRTVRFRERLVGLGFQEMATPVLTHRAKVTERMGRGGEDLVEILNPMSENFGVIRDSLLPTLLEVESQSYRAAYPHRIFEAGEGARQAPGTVLGTETRRFVCGLVAHAETGFAEIHSVLDSLLQGLGFGYRLQACEIAGFLEGRSGAILIGDLEVGVIGEIHPEVLDRWGIKVPAAALEIDLSTFDEKDL